MNQDLKRWMIAPRWIDRVHQSGTDKVGSQQATNAASYCTMKVGSSAHHEYMYIQYISVILLCSLSFCSLFGVPCPRANKCACAQWNSSVLLYYKVELAQEKGIKSSGIAGHQASSMLCHPRHSLRRCYLPQYPLQVSRSLLV